MEEERRQERRGGARHGTYPASEIYQVPPVSPSPSPVPGGQAGAGGELSGQKRSLVPPRRSSTTLPKLEERARASVCGPDLPPPLPRPGPLLSRALWTRPTFLLLSLLSLLSSIGHVLMWAGVARRGWGGWGGADGWRSAHTPDTTETTRGKTVGAWRGPGGGALLTGLSRK